MQSKSPASPAGLDAAKPLDAAAVPRTDGAPAFDSVEDSPLFRDRVRALLMREAVLPSGVHDRACEASLLGGILVPAEWCMLQ